MSEKSKKNWTVFLKILSYVATAIVSVISGNSIPPIEQLF